MVTPKGASGLLVSPERWVVVVFPEGTEPPWAELVADGCQPLDGSTWLVMQAVGERLPQGTQAAPGTWARVEIPGPFAKSELVSAATSALAEVEVPALAVSRARGLWLFVPQEKLGRALAALRQARLERFAPET